MKGVMGLITVAIASTIVFLIFIAGMYWAGIGGLQQELYLEMDSSTKEYEAETALNAVLRIDGVRDYIGSTGDLDNGDESLKKVQNYLKDNYQEWKVVIEKGPEILEQRNPETSFPGGTASTYVAAHDEDPVKITVKVGDRK
ncbi:MAG: hypothetical protein ABEJ03_01010 [Candidatus Nanohaloarchaea archaeon]